MTLPIRPQDRAQVVMFRRLMREEAMQWRRIARHRRTFYPHLAVSALNNAIALRDGARSVETGGCR